MQSNPSRAKFNGKNFVGCRCKWCHKRTHNDSKKRTLRSFRDGSHG